MLNPQSFYLLLFLSISFYSYGQRTVDIPKVYSHIQKDDTDSLFLENEGKKLYEFRRPSAYTLRAMRGDIQGDEKGLTFDFGKFEGTLYYGFIPYGDSKHPLPVYFRRDATVENGKASVNIKDQLSGRFDMIGWQENGKGTLGYRLVNQEGEIVYDGKVSFRGKGPFEVAPTIVEGPFVNLVGSETVTISFTSNQAISATVETNNQTFADAKATHRHEIKIDGLQPGQLYAYTVKIAEHEESYSFRTAPAPGSRTKFIFGYASDSRNGQGGGERNIYGTNAYIMKKIMALANYKNVSFVQFSGDLINGYLTDPEEMNLQYANWKRAIEPFGHYFPIYTGMGNHEALMRVFRGPSLTVSVDRFPFEEESAEKIFADNFVHPSNGPKSEDGASYDPDQNTVDFPSYEENVYSYQYDNIAVIVLNSNYFYAPSTQSVSLSSGNIHAYIMDQQLAWLKNELEKLEADPNIDHIFLTQHTPFFPNGGHVSDDMWYNGNNEFRPYIQGKSVDKGIIERRDDLLDLAVNKSSKVRAVMTGDEHNYAKTEVGPQTNMYPDNYEHERIKLRRTIYQINNGAAGAPYYAQEQTPWSPYVSGFTTQNALVLFHIEGKKIVMEVMNPDTLEAVDRLEFD